MVKIVTMKNSLTFDLRAAKATKDFERVIIVNRLSPHGGAGKLHVLKHDLDKLIGFCHPGGLRVVWLARKILFPLYPQNSATACFTRGRRCSFIPRVELRSGSRFQPQANRILDSDDSASSAYSSAALDFCPTRDRKPPSGDATPYNSAWRKNLDHKSKSPANLSSGEIRPPDASQRLLRQNVDSCWIHPNGEGHRDGR